jgi:outer membrane protein TolC
MGRVIQRCSFAKRLGIVLLACAPLVEARANAQIEHASPVASPENLSLPYVVQSASRDYPLVHVSEEELNASVATIRLARTAYLPRVDGLAQFNRATRNNVYGALFPQSTLPSMTGPVIGSNNAGSVWGSATALLVDWQPFDFGLRNANVQSARAERERAAATVLRSKLEIGSAAGDAFLGVVAAEQTVKAASAAVDDWQVLLRSTHALAAAQLRPGADESRIEAELAIAKTQLIYAQQADEVNRALLAKFVPSVSVGAPGLETSRLLSEMPASLDQDVPFQADQNPAMTEQKAATAQSQAQLHATERSWVPRFDLEAAGFARGTGAETDGTRLGGTGGLVPTVGNYAVGVNVTFAFMDFASIHAREASQAATVRANKAQEAQTDRDLQEQFARAEATLKAAREVATNTPVEVKAAHASLDQSKARYQSGLTPIDDLAQAERLVVQAEIDDSIARLNVWRAYLQLNAARGDLQPFLQAVSR